MIDPTAPPVQAAPVDPTSEEAVDPSKKRNEDFKARIDACKSYRRKLLPQWAVSIDYRRGKPFASQSDEDRIVVNMDWSLTKTKQAALFSQVPQVRISHPPQSTEQAWVHQFETRVNDTLVGAGIESAMDEVLPDVINAAGIGAVMVAYEAITIDKQVPAIDLSTIPPDLQQQMLQSGLLPNGQPIPMETVPEILDKRYTVQRISPADLLWPINFSGSDFDNAPWIGRSGRLNWAEAMKRFKLTEADKTSLLSTGDQRTTLDRLNRDNEKDRISPDEMVAFDEIFYKEISYDINSTSFSAIHHLVFVAGKDKPVIDESWKGQQLDQQNQILGALRYPIRILTLTYISDETIPPSDSAIGRPQVNELNKLRTQNMQQRERNLPLRWMDINRIDPTIQYALMRGNWQSIIPVQGQGDKVIGEVARAGMPSEHGTFEAMAKTDLGEAWSLGPNQLGSGQGVNTKGEASIIESNAQTRTSRERAIVGKHFCGIAEVLAGLMCLYDDPSTLGEGFDPIICKALSYSILADSTVLLDSNQRLKRLVDFINFTAKSGWVSLEPVLKEVATLSGLDPNQVIKPPIPKTPDQPTVSIRFTGIEDLSNPLVLAFILGQGKPPDPQLIEQAKQLIAMSTVLPQPIPPPPPQMGPDGVPLPAAPPTEMAMTPHVPILTPHPGPLPEVGPNPGPPPPVGDAHPDWVAAPRINKRAVER